MQVVVNTNRIGLKAVHLKELLPVIMVSSIRKESCVLFLTWPINKATGKFMICVGRLRISMNVTHNIDWFERVLRFESAVKPFRASRYVTRFHVDGRPSTYHR